MTSFRTLWLVLLGYVVITSSLGAQVQINPYLFQWRPNSDLLINAEGDRAERSLGVGAELIIGAKALSPLLGIVYQNRSYSLAEAGSFSLDELQLQLGLAYRLRAASTSFNLVPQLAICPSFTLGSSQDSNLPESVLSALENDLSWRLKAGFTLYLDFISLHYNWLPEIANDPDEQSYRQLGLGIRF